MGALDTAETTPGRADGDGDVAGLQVERERGGGVVAGARAEHLRRRGPRWPGLGRAEHPGEQRVVAEGELEQVVPVGPRSTGDQ